MADFDRIDRVLDRITDENLNMKHWAVKGSPCGTTMCFAGHVVDDEGIEINWYQDEMDLYNKETQTWETHKVWRADETKDGRLIEDVARELLEFDEEQAGYVFFATEIETVDELRQRVIEAVKLRLDLRVKVD